MGRDFVVACPVCRGQLAWLSAGAVYCAADDLTFRCEAGIWRFLPPARAAALAQFRQEYETVRQREGRSSDGAAFYRALPFAADQKHGWSERARRFEVLVEQVIRPLEDDRKRPLRILDLGAGNCWLSNRLAARRHDLAAVDLAVNTWDGLGAARHYETIFTCWQAEFNYLPLAADQADMVIFNASFHYSVNYEVTLQEARRVLRPEGVVVVMDTAVYQHEASGQQMVAEREAAFLQQYGFASNALASENFLTYDRIVALAISQQIDWQIRWPLPRWRRLGRQLKVKLRRQREPGQFPILAGRLRQ